MSIITAGSGSQNKIPTEGKLFFAQLPVGTLDHRHERKMMCCVYIKNCESKALNTVLQDSQEVECSSQDQMLSLE